MNREIMPKDLEMKKCTNSKNQGHGCDVRCGEREWGPDSQIYTCEKCTLAKIKRLELILLEALIVMECEGTNGYDFVSKIYDELGHLRCYGALRAYIDKMTQYKEREEHPK